MHGSWCVQVKATAGACSDIKAGVSGLSGAKKSDVDTDALGLLLPLAEGLCGFEE